MESITGHRLHVDVQELPNVLNEFAKVGQRPVVVHVNKQVEVAPFDVFSARRGTEDSYVARAGLEVVGGLNSYFRQICPQFPRLLLNATRSIWRI